MFATIAPYVLSCWIAVNGSCWFTGPVTVPSVVVTPTVVSQPVLVATPTPAPIAVSENVTATKPVTFSVVTTAPLAPAMAPVVQVLQQVCDEQLFSFIGEPILREDGLYEVTVAPQQGFTYVKWSMDDGMVNDFVVHTLAGRGSVGYSSSPVTIATSMGQLRVNLHVCLMTAMPTQEWIASEMANKPGSIYLVVDANGVAVQ